jgi:hypothetical protein
MVQGFLLGVSIFHLRSIWRLSGAAAEHRMPWGLRKSWDAAATLPKILGKTTWEIGRFGSQVYDRKLMHLHSETDIPVN